MSATEATSPCLPIYQGVLSPCLLSPLLAGELRRGGGALHFAFLYFDVPSPPVTPIDEPSPLNAADSVPQDISEAPFLPLNEALARYERQYLCQVLDWTGGNRAEAARLLHIPQRTLYRKLAKYNL